MLWFFIAGLLIIAVAYVLLPLFRTTDEVVDDRKQQNILIVREQVAELESSFERGEVDSDQYRERRDELEQSLLQDVSGQSDSAVANKTSTSSWMSAAFLVLFIPMAAIALYLELGTPNAQVLAEQSKPQEVPLTADGKPDIEKLVSSLHDKLRKNPANAEGWYMLGRSYMMMQRFDGAIEAYGNLYKLQPDEPEVMLMLADAMSMKQQGTMAGEPKELIEKALLKVPNHTTGLWLSGMGFEQEGNHQKALERWAVLRPLLNDNPQEQVQLDVLITRAKAALVTQQANAASSGAVASEVKPSTTESAEPSAAKELVSTDQATEVSKADSDKVVQITLKVSLSDEFLERVSPEDSVFLYAKAQTGPPLPLAAKRLQVKNLPITMILDDTMAMMPQFKLSSFSTLIVGARVSKSGDAISQNGDLIVEVEQVSHGDEVTLVINRILKK
ncbi:c-type cytochrome biogenesis protein CcmI [Leucothrix arctica]|uniref:C-type cytochrome biogenesis protein CcmI n=1 Tax=Leucothrix arctica TaxID=1481894 RepID=A0A317CFB0_9GAMM|nr:c-type cytochrome biogenesis protein CcmI [Leucothrix arctica]PWQ95000.1 c-type cytochrome biogenesis protein CcmI [Leucothrix arctica]